MLEPLSITSGRDPQQQQKELTAQQLEAVVMLAEGRSITATAGTIGVSEKTIDRWKHIPEFREAIKQARLDVYQSALDLVMSNMPSAVRTLVRNLEAKQTYIQVQAASELLKLGIDLHSVSELENKVNELESRLTDKRKDSNVWAI